MFLTATGKIGWAVVFCLYISEGNIIAGNEQQRGKGNLLYDPNT